MCLGDAVNFDEMFREHRQYVRHRLERVGIPSADLDDVVQETFIVALRLRHKLHAYAEARPWLAAIAWRCASNWRRGLRRRGKYHAAYGCHRAIETQSGNAEQLPARVELLECLQLLGVQGHIVTLRYGFGLTASEIGCRLGLKSNTVRSRLHAARAVLVRRVEPVPSRKRPVVPRRRAERNGVRSNSGSRLLVPANGQPTWWTVSDERWVGC